jgi:hypothetical protein
MPPESDSHLKFGCETRIVHVSIQLQRFQNGPLLQGYWMMEYMHILCENLLKKWNIRETNIDFTVSGLPEEYQKTDKDSVLSSLTMLRCKHATITNISDGYAAELAAELTAAMMSPKLIQNVYTMKDALADFIYSDPLNGERFDANDEWYAFIQCVSACDIEEFVKTRAKIMEKIAEDRKERESVMVEEDRLDWAAEPY